MQKNAPWLSVPQFGDWDQKGQVPDYSLDFSKIRENRKQNKRDLSRASLGNEEELIASSTTTSSTSGSNPQIDQHYHHSQHSPTVRFLASFLLWFCLVAFFNGVSNTARYVLVGSYKGEREREREEHSIQLLWWWHASCMWLDGGEIASLVLNTVGQYPKLLMSR